MIKHKLVNSLDNNQDIPSQLQEYPYSPTPEQPSTIIEVTENSSGDLQDKQRRTSNNSSEEYTVDHLHRERESQKTSWISQFSASDEGIEDINEECSSLNSQPGILKITATHKVTTPSIDSGNPDSFPPDRNNLFMAERMIKRRHSADTLRRSQHHRSQSVSVKE